MQGPSEQRNPICRKLKDGFNNFKARRSRTAGLSAQRESSQTGGEADVSRLRSNPENTITPIDNGEDSLVGSGVAAISGSNPENTITPIDNGGGSLVGSGVAAITDAQSKRTGTNPTIEWKDWNIDGDAINQLRKWGGDHENSKWLKLAEKIDQSLKSKTLDALKGFVPDSPFPARTLVKALLNLVELGINIPLTQKKVSEFAKEAIEYISALIVVADEEPLVKEDLKTICATVNEICRWAKERVSKKSLEDDSGDWESKFTSAKAKFLAIAITKGRVKQEIDSRLLSIKETLASRIAAKYEYQSKRLCADGTRVQLLADIKDWLLLQPSNAERIIWVTGIPGSGKSTLSATIVEILRKNGTPVSAQYFISRNIPETIDADKIIPTIARQLAISSPTAARVLEQGLENGYPGERDEQVTSLLLDPIRELSKSRDVVVIIIDALDELKDADRSVMEILSLIAPIDCDLPNNVRFIITSRPEHWTDISQSELKHTVFKRYSLTTESSVTEVHEFVVARMKAIVTAWLKLTPNDPNWHHWVDLSQLQRLSDEANGLFHYAATGLQWIEDQIHQHGTACRKKIFNLFSKDGLGGLERLYKHILISWQVDKDVGGDVDEVADELAKGNDRDHAARLDGFQHVVGTILVLRKPLSVEEIVALLSDITEDKFDIRLFFQRMRSVFGTTSSDDSPQMHKSFRDYIMTRAPDGFKILTEDAHSKIARSCLDNIVKAGSGAGNVNKYAVTYWHEHLREAGAKCDDERMWMLLGKMVNEGVVSMWTRNWDWLDVFTSVAGIGWKLLKQKTDERKLLPMSNMLVKIKLRSNCNDLMDVLRNRRIRHDHDILLDTDPYIPYKGIWDDGLLETWKAY